MKNYDVVIVGSGPAGASLGWRLALQGKSVAILEKESNPVRKICGEYLCPQGVQILRDWGLSEFVDDSLMIKGMRIFSPKGEELLCDFPSGAGISLRRDEFDEMLRQGAIRAGAELFCGVRFEAASLLGKKWLVQTSAEDFTCKLLLGADGVRSQLAKSVGLFSECNTSRVAVHCFVDSLEERTPYGEMHLYEQGTYLGVNPTGMKELNLGYVLDSDRLREFENSKDFLLQTISKDHKLRKRLDMCTLREIKVTPSLHRRIRAISGRRVALAGDAAGFLDPLTGEGLYGALLSAQILGQQMEGVDLDSEELLREALNTYAETFKQVKFTKNLINTGFQWLIRHEKLLNWIGDRLAIRPNYRTALVGVIGNVIRPHEALQYCLG